MITLENIYKLEEEIKKIIELMSDKAVHYVVDMFILCHNTTILDGKNFTDYIKKENSDGKYLRTDVILILVLLKSYYKDKSDSFNRMNYHSTLLDILSHCGLLYKFENNL